MANQWRKSSTSGATGCVEVRLPDTPSGLTLVRDSKAPGAGLLAFTAAEWDAFLAGVRGGEFDLSAKPDRADG